MHKFAVPPTLIAKKEFKNVWTMVETISRRRLARAHLLPYDGTNRRKKAREGIPSPIF